SLRKWRDVVGHEHENRSAISPAVIRSPRKCRISRICRRAALSSAANTASVSARYCLAFETDFERLDKRELHGGTAVTRLAELAHRLPHGHHVGDLVRAVGAALLLPIQQLDEDRLLVALRALIDRGRD